MRKKIVHAACLFFAAMLIFTLLSRAADSINVIQVQVKNPGNQVITHKVTGTGKVEGSQEIAVFAQENLQIEQVLAHAGQSVKKGDVLLTFSEESMKAAAKVLEDKVKTLEGQVKDLKSQKKVDQERRSTEQAYAGASYSLAAQSSNISVDSARTEVQIAQQRLDEFYQNREKKREENEYTGFTDGGIGADLPVDEFSAFGGETQQSDSSQGDSEQDGFVQGDSSQSASSQGESQDGSSQSDSSQDDSATEAALLDDLRGKQENLNAAIAGQNQALASAQKGIADASISQASDSSQENAERELENAKEDLKKIQELQNAGGAVTVPTDGVLKSLAVQTGDLTGQTAVAVLYPAGGILRMTGTISKDDVKYADPGTAVQVTDNNDNDINGASVETVTENDEDNNIRDIFVVLPEDSLSIGQSASFSISRDAGPYPCCVPLSAIYEEEGKNYVYTIDTENTVLGTVSVARKVEVAVTDRNQTTAALDSGSISTGQQVIVQADRDLKDGCRVRISEN